MKIVGVIPARFASTRFPGKCLHPLCGKPLVLWVLERARQARCLDELLVAVDDPRVAKVVTQAGGTAVMTSPNHPSGTDRAAEAVAGRGAGTIINIQGDEPLVDPALIDRLGEALEDGRWDMATAAEPLARAKDRDHPNVVKVVWDAEGRALYFSRHAIPFLRDPPPAGGPVAEGLYWRHVGLYAYRAPFLERLVREPPCAIEQAEKLEQLRALYLGARIRVLRTETTGPGVDAPGDVPAAEAALRAAGLCPDPARS